MALGCLHVFLKGQLEHKTFVGLTYLLNISNLFMSVILKLFELFIMIIMFVGEQVE